MYGVNSIMENVDSHVHWQSGVMEESLRPSIGAASTNQTRSGVKVIIKWNTLSPQLPRGLPLTLVAAVITSDNINHYHRDL